MNAHYALEVLRKSLENTRTSIETHRQKENHWMSLRDSDRAMRSTYETRAAEIEAAIAKLEEVAA